MKKRDMKALHKEVHSFAVGGLDRKEQRAIQQKAKVKLPYNMYQGMQSKNKDRSHKTESSDKVAGIIGESSR